MTKILFVDDETKVLEALQRMLRPQRKEWHMVFINSGDEALRSLGANSFDVVVTDMRMPGMDGAQLLEIVCERFPSVVRIVLSGQFDRDTAIRAAPVAHQFLAKPCSPDQLRAAIQRAGECRRMLSDDSARRIVAAVGELPALPRNCVSLMQQLDDSDASLNDIADTIQHDVGMAAKVLQLANSAFFGSLRHVNDVRAAVRCLGTEVLKQLAISVSLFRELCLKRPISGFSMEEFQRHSQLAARIAARISVSKEVAATAAIASLLHDVGQLVLAGRLPDQFETALAIAAKERRPLHAVEEEVIATNHAQIGAYLLGLWNLPGPVVSAVRHHHNLATLDAGEPVEAAVLVYAANILAHTYGPSAQNHDIALQDGIGLDLENLKALGVADRWQEWASIAQDVVSREDRAGS